MPWGPSAVRLGVRGLSVPTPDVLLLDSRDSFTFNLAQACAELGAEVDVVDADLVTADQIISARELGGGPSLVMIGPGPRGPRELPRLVELVRDLDGAVPLFGVCLGLQVIVKARGGVVERAAAPVHGKRDAIAHDDVGCLRGLPSPLWVMRYHSLIAASVPPSLTVTARDAAGQPMGLRDPRAAVEAVQFHPESIGTAGGMQLLHNVLAGAGIGVTLPAGRMGAVPPPTSRGPGFRDDASGSGSVALEEHP
jgi:anthranilate synthase/aminodeoxychorismate synthase-like glutamine amidotransferase